MARDTEVHRRGSARQFPLNDPSACATLRRALTEARQAMAGLNQKNCDIGRAPLNCGIGVYVGESCTATLEHVSGSTAPLSVPGQHGFWSRNSQQVAALIRP
jgi:hypothetical protein